MKAAPHGCRSSAAAAGAIVRIVERAFPPAAGGSYPFKAPGRRLSRLTQERIRHTIALTGLQAGHRAGDFIDPIDVRRDHLALWRRKADLLPFAEFRRRVYRFARVSLAFRVRHTGARSGLLKGLLELPDPLHETVAPKRIVEIPHRPIEGCIVDAPSPASSAVALQGVRGFMHNDMGEGVGRGCIAINESVASDLVGVGPFMVVVAQVIRHHANAIGNGMTSTTGSMAIAGLPTASDAIANPRVARCVIIT